MVTESRINNYINTLPLCPMDGWPRFCACNMQVQWFFGGEIVGAISIEQFIYEDDRGVPPEEVVQRFLDEVRSRAH